MSTTHPSAYSSLGKEWREPRHTVPCRNSIDSYDAETLSCGLRASSGASVTDANVVHLRTQRIAERSQSYFSTEMVPATQLYYTEAPPITSTTGLRRMNRTSSSQG